MDFLFVTFPASGVQTWVILPPVVAFAISFFTSMGGISGAFMLLPFQLSVLNYTSPSVSGTNQLFNIVATPSGVFRYFKEKRMVWPLAWAVVVGTLPGVLIGAWIRLEYLPDPGNFKSFAGLVLGYIGLRLLSDIVTSRRSKKKTSLKNTNPAPQPSDFTITNTRLSLSRVSFDFERKTYSFSLPGIFTMTFAVGIIGGIYGIGGGAIIAPFFVTFFHLPVYTIAGAALMGTFVTSVAGVVTYQVLSVFYPATSVAPDWTLGLLFGLGGFAGMYLGARCQKYVPPYIIKLILCFCVLFVAGSYILEFFK